MFGLGDVWNGVKKVAAPAFALGPAVAPILPAVAATGGAIGASAAGGPPVPGQTPLAQTGPNPDISAMRRRLESIKSPDKVLATGPAAVGDAYQAKTISGPLPEYDYARKKAAESISSQASQNQDAITRRFAAMGALNSGSAIKQQQIAGDEALRARADAEEAIGAQEAQTRREQQALEENKAFTSGESLKGRQFAAGESATQRQMQADLFNADQAFKDQVFRFDSDAKITQLDLAWRESQRQSAEDAFNKEMAEWQKQHSGGLLGAGGFLGTGIG